MPGWNTVGALLPDFVVRRFVDVTPEDIARLAPGVRAVCMDIDGTVTDYHAPAVPAEAQARIRSFREAGLLTFIMSNCYDARVSEVHALFDPLVTDVLTPFACVDPADAADRPRKHRKPAPDMFHAAAARHTVTDPATGASRPLRSAEMLMIGDQMFKDVLSARRAGARAVLLPRLGRGDHPGVRLLQRPVEFAIRAATAVFRLGGGPWLPLPLLPRDWPRRLAPVSGNTTAPPG